VNEPIVEMGGATATQEPSVDLEEMAGVGEGLSPMVSTENQLKKLEKKLRRFQNLW